MTPNQYLDVVGARVDLMDAAATLNEMRRKFLDAAQKLAAESKRQEGEFGRRYSVVRAIAAAATPHGGVVDGPELEMSQELARRAGMYHDPHKPFIPLWALNTRSTMNTGVGTQGGHLVGLNTSRHADALFASSTLTRLGMNIVPAAPSDVSYPRVVTNPGVMWVAEGGTATSSEMTLGAIAVAMRTVTSVSEVTKQLLIQGEAAQPRIVASMSGALAAAIDAACIAGTGTTQPTGIINTAGIGTAVSASNFSHATAQGLLRVAATANVPDENICWLSTPAIRETLSQRATGTGNEARYIWQQGNIADKRAYTSTNCLSGAILCGDPSTLDLLMWGGGIQVAVNPYGAGFMSEILQLRVTAYCDLVVTQPQAWAVGTGLT